MMLMIVEDNAGMRRLIKSLVADLADAICECDDGAAAVAVYAARRPDWVLMDIELKHMDGIAASRQIVAAFPQARIAIVTSFDCDRLRRAAAEAGVQWYILKDNLPEVRALLRAA